MPFKPGIAANPNGFSKYKINPCRYIEPKKIYQISSLQISTAQELVGKQNERFLLAPSFCAKLAGQEATQEDASE